MSGELAVSSSDRGGLPMMIPSASRDLGVLVSTPVVLVSMPWTSPESSESVLTLRDFDSELSSETLVQRDVAVSEWRDGDDDFSVSVISLSRDDGVAPGETVGVRSRALPSALSFDFWACTSCWQWKHITSAVNSFF